jgi:hypothetical protein
MPYTPYVAITNDLCSKVDVWAAKQFDKPTRTEAIRRLLELGLATGSTQRSTGKQKTRASQMAGQTIDNLVESAASAEDKASRKKRLLKGPEEFRKLRVDRPKADAE